MKKAFLAIAFAAALLAGCSKTAEQAPAQTPAQVPDEPYEAVDYRLYPSPEGGYVGDTMPYVVDGRLELYYLYDTDHNGQGYHPIYKYSTPNLYEYQDHGMVLNYGTMADPDPALGTGSVLQDKDGLYHLFYTGHNDTYGNAGRDRECVMHAVSTDRENWTKVPEDTFYSAENYSHDDFRDPLVFWNEEENCYWLLIGAHENTEGGVVAKYTSDDLKNWTLCDPLFAPHAQYMLECPDLFKLGDHYYLTYSWDCVTYYAVGDSMNGPFYAPYDNVLDGNNFIFYAGKTGELNGTRYLCGWLGRSALSDDSGLYQWAGNVLNHQLVAKEDGKLGVCAPEVFHEYFTEEVPVSAVEKKGKVEITDEAITLTGETDAVALADLGMRKPTMMLECDVTFGNDGCAGFAFGGVNDEPYMALCLDAKKGLLHYEATEVDELANWDPVAFTKFDFSASDTHHVTLVCENEIVILYVDNTKALSSRITRSINGAHFGVFADETEAVFSNFKVTVPAA